MRMEQWILDLTARVAELEAALKWLRDSPFCDLENQEATSYGRGVCDGHRACAEFARGYVGDREPLENTDNNITA